MPKLTTQHKRAIIERLACFESPTEVQTAMKAEFAIDVSLPQILYYKPESAGSELGQQWKDLHTEIRKRFLEGTGDIAIAQKSFRLRRLEGMARELERRKNYELAAKLYEQAAKEIGEAYTNRREITGKDGGPLETRDRSLEGLSTEELKTLALQLAGATAGDASAA